MRSFVYCGVVFAVVTVTVAILDPTEDYDNWSNYNFQYGVEDHSTGDIKSHHEVRQGKEVTGVYTVREPDGSTRVVKYKAHPLTGFNAVVEKIDDKGSTANSYGAFAGGINNLYEAAASDQQYVVTEQSDDGTLGAIHFAQP